MLILVIDDDPDLLDNISIMLEIAGYEVLRADNGVNGLRLIHERRPDLIICDVIMPDVTGFDVLEELQSNSNTVSIPVVFLTSKSQIEDIRRGMQAGADDYLTKPFTEFDLLTTIQKRLEKRHQWELQQRIAFAHDLVQAHEQEAQRIAQDLDQNFRQKLLNIKFYLDTQMPSSKEPLLATMQNSIEELLSQVTVLSYAMYPVMLTHLGLIATLEWYFNIVQQRQNISVKLDTYNMEQRLSDTIELIFYRIAQRVMEQLTRVTHEVCVTLWRDENTVHFSFLRLPILDKQSNLMQFLEEYGFTINAQVVLQTDEESGTTIHVILANAVFQRTLATAPLPQVHPKSSREKLLLAVSPDKAFLEQIMQLLASVVRIVPYQTDDPESVSASVRLHVPQIVVLDLLTPSSVLSALSRETAIILLSPYSDEAFAKQTLRQGVMGFIPKVKAYSELAIAVQTVMNGERYISAALIMGGNQAQNTKSLNLDALLTRREREIMELILRDLTHADIASRLVISPRTVEKHRANMMQKLALSTHTELILFALRHGLIAPS